MRLVFVSDRKDPHRDRFARLFATVTSSFVEISLEGSEGTKEGFGSWNSMDELRALLEKEQTLLVSGPLDSVSAQLAGGSYRHIGISWATDVMVTAARSREGLVRLVNTAKTLDAVITDNLATENALLSLGVAAEAILRVPWGPEKGGEGFSPSRADLGLPEGVPLIFFPRSLAEHYQPHVFVEALHDVVNRGLDVHAVFVESGPLIEDVKEKIGQAGLTNRVHWVSPRPAGEFRGILSVCDAIVVSSITDGTSVTVMEAMEEGVPVISSLTNGAAEWVLDGVTGWTFPVGDPQKLAECMARVVTMEQSWRAMVTNHAHHLVSLRAGWEISSAKITDLLKKFL